MRLNLEGDRLPFIVHRPVHGYYVSGIKATGEQTQTKWPMGCKQIAG